MATMDSSQDAFDFLFPAPLAAGPTPMSTPNLGFISEGESFGDVGSSHPTKEDNNLNETSSLYTTSRRLAALNAAKTFLSHVGTSSPEIRNGRTGVKRLQEKLKKAAVGTGPDGRDIREAFRMLLADWPETRTVRSVGGMQQQNIWDEDILEWYIFLIKADFQANIAPLIQGLWNDGSEDEDGRPKSPKVLLSKFEQTCDMLSFSQQLYSIAVVDYMMPVLALSESNAVQVQGTFARPTDLAAKLGKKCSRAIHAMFAELLPTEAIYEAMFSITLDCCARIFRLEATANKPGHERKRSVSSPSKYRVKPELSIHLMQLFENLREVGLGGPSALRTFAQAMEELVVQFIASTWMDVDWKNRKTMVGDLTDWMQRVFTPFVRRAAECLSGDEDARMEEETKQWLDMAIAWLGKRRVERLFTYICAWPASEGAILDLKAFAKTPEARRYLTVRFQQDVERNLLHAGTTTRQILDVYMLVIQVFAHIDSRGVLLDNVSRPIRRYLKTRGDSAKIIISSMLADPHDPAIDASPDISKAIANEMLRPIGTDAQRQDRELDYDNMEYMPQPNDASADFKRNESNDAVSHLLSLYDKEQFLSVLKNIFGEHLLKTVDDMDLEKETHLLELFKSRFGYDKLQACDVMLQDIANSRRLNKAIVKLPGFKTAAASGAGLTTQVLSSRFWPDLRDDEFTMPEPVQRLQAEFAKGFEAQHNAMRLSWLPALGRATVELQLEDRTVTENVPPWVASVIYAFDGATVSKTAEELEEQLEMEDTLVKNALTFWVGKRVLMEKDGLYSVLETLEDQSQYGAAQMVVQEEVTAVRSQQDLFEEKSPMYANFVLAMLTNGGSMPLPMILQMLKMVFPGGFPFGEIELTSLLQGMVDEGKLMSNGQTYGVKKT
jgi:anaphase-promoting complex subunit 2